MKKQLLPAVLVVAVLSVWLAFRPEKLFINETVSEAFPTAAAAAPASSQPVTLRAGKFHAVAHEGQGDARIYETPGGKRVLRFTNFKTSNGPKLHVYLIAAPDAADDATVKKSAFIDLGPLKGNQGDQNYELASGADLDKYRAVTIWCARFNVNFATAPLTRN